MTLRIVGMSEMQKCGLKYVIHSPWIWLDLRSSSFTSGMKKVRQSRFRPAPDAPKKGYCRPSAIIVPCTADQASLAFFPSPLP
jgi:hypothetical protein